MLKKLSKNMPFAFGASLAASLALQGCLFAGLNKDSDAFLASLGAAGANGLQVFTAEVFPKYAQASCNKCHSTSQSPLFALVDAALSYPISRGLLNLEKPESSKLVVKAADNHYGASAKNLGAEVWAEAVKKWAEAEKASGAANSSSSSELVTGVFTIPNAMITPNPQDFSISLDSLGPDFQSTSLLFKLEVGDPSNASATAFKTAGAVLINKLRFVNNSGRGFDVGAIKVYQDGVFTEGVHDSFMDTGSLLAPSSTTVISGNYIMLSLTAGLQIRFGFQKLKAIDFVGCQQTALFVSNYRNPVMNTECTACHGGGTNATVALATSKFSMKTIDSDSIVCAKALQHVNIGNPTASSLLMQPCQGANGHTTFKQNTQTPFALCSDTAKFNGALDWINQE